MDNIQGKLVRPELNQTSLVKGSSANTNPGWMFLADLQHTGLYNDGGICPATVNAKTCDPIRKYPSNQELSTHYHDSLRDQHDNPDSPQCCDSHWG